MTIGGGSYLAGIGQALGARAYSPVTVLPETAGRSAAPLAILAALGTVLALASRSPRSPG